MVHSELRRTSYVADGQQLALSFCVATPTQIPDVIENQMLSADKIICLNLTSSEMWKHVETLIDMNQHKGWGFGTFSP